MHGFAFHVAAETPAAAMEFDLADAIVPDGEGPGPEPAAVRTLQLPPAPSSAALVLSAMLTLGAWQVLRSASNLHLAPLPGWYHSGGPKQIGHVTPLDLHFGHLAPCPFEGPAIEPEVTSFVLRRPGDASPATEQRPLSSRAPRAPPASF